MIIIVRTAIMYLIVIFSLRFMGKKQIGQLQPSELAIAIMISELASIPLESKDVPLLSGIVPVLVLVVLEIAVSYAELKSIKLRKLFTGTPGMLVENGRLKESDMKNLRFSTDDLVEEMRMNGIMHIQDIEYAFLETTGKVSFILNKTATPPTSDDFKNGLKPDSMPFTVVNKGKIQYGNLKNIKKDEKWLQNELKKEKIKLSDLLILCANKDGITFFQLFEKAEGKQ